MSNVEDEPLPYISPSVVTFYSPIDEYEPQSKSAGNLDWTIQREISIIIEYIGQSYYQVNLS